MKTSIARIPLTHIYSTSKIKRFDSIFALPQFLHEKALDLDGVPMYLEQELDDARILWPVIVSRFKKFNVPFFNRATCPAPPQIVKGSLPFSQTNAIFLELAKYFCRNYRCKMITLLQSPHDPKFIKNNVNGWQTLSIHDIMVDLSRDLRTIYFNMKKRHRYTIRKAIKGSDSDVLSSGWLDKTNYSVREGTGSLDLLEFRDLWTETLEKIKSARARRFLYGDPWSLRRLRTLFTVIRPNGLCRLFTMYDDRGKAGVSMIILMSGNFTRVPVAVWSAGAASREGKRKGLPLLLQWYVIRWLKNQEYAKYFLGGVDVNNPTSGPTLFKRGFGGETISGLQTMWVSPILSLGLQVVRKLLGTP